MFGVDQSMKAERIGHRLSQLVGFLLAALILLVLFAVACSQVETAGETAVSLSAAWGRPSPALADTAAFYLTIANEGAVAEKLVGVETAVCTTAELHTTLMEEGVMKMRHVEGGIEIPANGNVALEPGGYHIMCMGLTQPLVAGDEIPLTLTFAAAGEMAITAVIREE